MATATWWAQIKNVMASTSKRTVALRAKCIIVGDSTVGKSALTQSFASDGTQFPKAYSMTTGVDICVKAVNIPKTNVTVEMYIHDCAGKEIFYDHVQQSLDDCGVVIVMYDVTNEQSFASCSKWLKRVEAQKSSPDLLLPGVLIANKTDLEGRRVVGTEEGKTFASNNSLEYFESSVKHHDNCEEPFSALADKFYKYYGDKIEIVKHLR